MNEIIKIEVPNGTSKWSFQFITYKTNLTEYEPYSVYYLIIMRALAHNYAKKLFFAILFFFFF